MLPLVDFVSVIIVNWNGKKWLKQCLDSLYLQTYPHIEVIVVDNHSTDGSVHFLKQEYPHVIVVENTDNVGFAEANNIGYRKARGEYILLLNNDTIVEKHFLSTLVSELIQRKTIGVVQPKIILMDDRNKLDTVGGFLTKSGFLYHYGVYKHPDDDQYQKKMAIFSPKGACILIKREVIEAVGLFDTDFFAYFEETDFAHRVWLAGYEILYVPNAVIYHKMGGTFQWMDNAFIQFHSYKNRICSYLKNLGLWELVKLLILHFLICEGASFVYVLTRKRDIFFAIQKAWWWNLIHLPSTLQKRRVVQRQIRKIDDRALMPLIRRNVRWSYYYYILTGLEHYDDER